MQPFQRRFLLPTPAQFPSNYEQSLPNPRGPWLDVNQMAEVQMRMNQEEQRHRHQYWNPRKHWKPQQYHHKS